MKQLISVVAAAAALSAAPVIAGAAPETAAFTNGPVSLSTCNSYTAPGFVATLEGPGVAIPDIPFVEISFVNRFELAAKKVRFALRSSAGAEVIVDSGTFSPGTTITHLFSPNSVGTNGVQCAVESVVFADGSAWMRQAPTQ